MSYNQEMLESKELYDYIKIGKSGTIGVAMALTDNKHNQFVSQFNANQQNDRLKNEMISLCNLQIHLNNSINASIKTGEHIQQLISDSENNENNAIIDANINQTFDEKLTQISAQNNSKPEDDENYKKLLDILSEFTNDSQENSGNNDSNDEELIAIVNDEQRIPIDPFSKLEIVNPVKNKKCHHIYDREQLRLVLESRQNAKIRCPNVGCGNKSVTMADVEDDRKTKAMIDNIRRQQNK